MLWSNRARPWGRLVAAQTEPRRWARRGRTDRAIKLLDLGLLAVMTLIVYLSSLRYGFLWDDPRWFSQPQQLSQREIWLAPRTVQYYRPLTLELNLLMARADKTHDALLHHALQVGAHLACVGLLYVLGGQLGLSRLSAVVTAMLFALHPFSHQAVAWAAPQQPISTAFGLLSLVLYTHGRQKGRSAWIGSSLIALVIALLIIESSVVFCVVLFAIEACRWRQMDRTRPSVWPLAHGTSVVLFVVLWQIVPKLPGVRGTGGDVRVLVYLLQGISYPIVSGLGRFVALDGAQALSVVGAASSLVLVWLALVLWRGGRVDLWVIALAFLGPNLLLMWKEVGYTYASATSRAFYPSAPGAALLWGALIDLAIGPERWRRLWRTFCFLLACVLSLQSVQTIADLNRLYSVGARHMDRLIDVVDRSDQRLLFVNFPDRLSLRSADYFLGYWGMILAPVSVDLGEYARLTRGTGAETRSLSAVYMAANLARWRYQVDIRGVVARPQDLRQALLWADHTYLTEYLPGDTLLLSEASTLSDVSAGNGPVAVWLDDQGNVVAYLRSIKVDFAHGSAGLRTSDTRFPRIERELVVVLVWECVRPARPQETIFVHLYEPHGSFPTDGHDGDPALRLLPMASWQPGDVVRDIRYLDVSQSSDLEGAMIGVGMYNWLTSERLAVTDPQGLQLADNVYLYPISLQ